MKEKKLLIVESPSKAKTIEKYLGGDYTVRASVGHIRDLPKSNKNAIDIEGGFIPHYEISKAKEKVVHELKSLGGMQFHRNDVKSVFVGDVLGNHFLYLVKNDPSKTENVSSALAIL